MICLFSHILSRYMTDDTNLPRWFLKEEEKYYKKNVPVTKVNIFFLSAICIKDRNYTFTETIATIKNIFIFDYGKCLGNFCM